MNQLIDYGHCLQPKKAKDSQLQAAPIIIRFQSRLHLQMFFCHKKDFLPSKRQEFSIVKDKTSANTAILKVLKSNVKNKKAWLVTEKLFYTLKETMLGSSSYRLHSAINHFNQDPTNPISYCIIIIAQTIFLSIWTKMRVHLLRVNCVFILSDI